MEVVVQRNPIPESPGYTVSAYIGGYRPDIIVIIQIDYKYYFAVYEVVNERYYVQLLNSRDVFNSSVSIPLKTILYNFEKQKFEDVRVGYIVLESIPTPINFELLGLSLSSETDPKVWTGNLLVKEISGPYQDNNLVDVIDLTQSVYYLATPSDINAHDSQVLSIKWEYQYNNEESVAFKNSKRSLMIENGVKKCKLVCSFHNKEDILDITLFAFYKTKSAKVSLKTPTGNKKTEEKSKLIWGSKVSVEFENKVIQICKELWGDDKIIEMANGLMAVMAVETGRTFKAHRIAGKPLKDPNSLTKDDFKNGENSSRAVGLIQFTQVALEQLGDFNKGSGFDKLHEVKLKYARMGEIKQLDKVKQYLAPSKNKIKSPEDIYLQVFAPIGVGKSDSFVLYKNGTPEYQQNESLDKQGNNNDKIERKELLSRYYKAYNEGKEFMTSKSEPNIEANTPNSNDNPSDESEEEYFWHDPVDNPRLTKYNYNGIVKPASGTYGYCRRNINGSKKFHSGFDFFAIPGKDKVYACLKGNVHQVRYSESAGWIVRIKIQNVKDLLLQEKKINYKTQFTDELIGIDIKETDDVYFIYMHLDRAVVTAEDAKKKREIGAGELLGYAGVSGSIANGGKAPHIHLEIATVLDAYKKGTSVRTNPARFVKLNSYNTKDQDEAAKIKHK